MNKNIEMDLLDCLGFSGDGHGWHFKAVVSKYKSLPVQADTWLSSTVTQLKVVVAKHDRRAIAVPPFEWLLSFYLIYFQSNLKFKFEYKF